MTRAPPTNTAMKAIAHVEGRVVQFREDTFRRQFYEVRLDGVVTSNTHGMIAYICPVVVESTQTLVGVV